MKINKEFIGVLVNGFNQGDSLRKMRRFFHNAAVGLEVPMHFEILLCEPTTAEGQTEYGWRKGRPIALKQIEVALDQVRSYTANSFLNSNVKVVAEKSGRGIMLEIRPNTFEDTRDFYLTYRSAVMDILQELSYQKAL